MGLIGNYSVILKSCGNYVSGATISDNRSNWNTSGRSRRYYFGAYGQKNAIPNGYRMPNSWVMAQKSGELSVYNGLSLGTNISLTLAAGKNSTANLTIDLDITNAQLGLIVSAVSDLMMAISMSGNLTATASMTSNLTISTSVTAALTALAQLVCNLTSSVTLNGTNTAIGEMSADITSLTTLSPENLAAAVWNSIAANFNNTGTMGEKLNDAGSASNPWTEVLEGSYTAADMLRLLTAIAAGKTTIVDLGGGLATVTFRDINDTVDRVVADMTNSERTDVTLDL